MILIDGLEIDEEDVARKAREVVVRPGDCEVCGAPLYLGGEGDWAIRALDGAETRVCSDCSKILVLTLTRADIRVRIGLLEHPALLWRKYATRTGG